MAAERLLCVLLAMTVQRSMVIMPQMTSTVNSSHARLEMQSSPFNLPLDGYPAFVREETDTATPRTMIPIYYFHDLRHPFCQNSACACQQRRSEAARLLGLVFESILRLQEAATLIDGKRGEREL